MPKAKITASEGDDRLLSRLQSSFSIGINNHINPANAWNISTGLHLELSNWNFFMHIPDVSAAPVIENKDVDFAIALPVLVIRNFLFNDKGFFNVQAGLKLSFNGFSSGQTITTYIGDSNNQVTQVFNGEFNTQKRPWISLLAGAGKSIYLKNKNLLSMELLFELNGASFVEGNYEITIPGKPATRGTYAARHSRIGLSLQYIFVRKQKFIPS